MDFLFVPFKKGFKKVPLPALLYIRASASQSVLVLTTGEITSPVSYVQFEKILKRRLCRVSNTHFVLLDKIISFDRHSVQLPGISIRLEKRYAGLLKDKVHIIDPGPGGGLAVNTGGRLTRL